MNSKQRRKAIRLTNQIIIIYNAIYALGSYYKLDETHRKEHYELTKQYLKLDKKLKGRRYFKNSYFAEIFKKCLNEDSELIKFDSNSSDEDIDNFFNSI